MTCDLPTDAQWEYACRAGTPTYYNDGLGTPSNLKTNAQMDALGRYKYNGGHIYNGSAWVAPAQNCTDANGTAKVGSYQPNNWGLYDMHGNIYEWVLDQWGSLTHATDPVGATNTTWRTARAGGYGNEGDYTDSGQRTALDPGLYGDFMGFRVTRTLP
jgi:formylglycine-generating enzyme required for sulfatase activity